MARVVVVGGGFGGLASAVRLAKIGHEVTLLEASDRLGGALGTVEQEGFRWDAGPTQTMLPAVLRDLFRKSGRPLEKELELVPVDPVRQHRFEDDDAVLDLPGGSRAAQMEAIEAAFGDGCRRAVDGVRRRLRRRLGGAAAATTSSVPSPPSTPRSTPRRCSRRG